MKRVAIGLSCLLAVGAGTPLVRPEAPTAADPDDPSTEPARAARMTADEANRWTIRLGDPAPPTAVVGAEPHLRYTNPGVGRVHGSVYLFIAEGRPAAILSIYKWFSPWTGFEAEIQSLTTEPIRGFRDDQVIWHPTRPGIEWHTVPDAPVPASTGAARLGQIRTIAQNFAGRLTDARVDLAGADQILRMLPRPLHRQEPRDASTHDGALFAFVLGTDPEVVLLLETRATPQGPRWHYALARLNSDPIQITYQGQPVWSAAKITNRYDPDATYFAKELPQPASNP